MMKNALPTRPEAIMFDLDDTLISFEGVSEQAWVKCCEDFISRHEIHYNNVRLNGLSAIKPCIVFMKLIYTSE